MLSHYFRVPTKRGLMEPYLHMFVDNNVLFNVPTQNKQKYFSSTRNKDKPIKNYEEKDNSCAVKLHLSSWSWKLNHFCFLINKNLLSMSYIILENTKAWQVFTPFIAILNKKSHYKVCLTFINFRKTYLCIYNFSTLYNILL